MAQSAPRNDARDRRRRVAIAGHEGDVATARAHLRDPDPAVRATALGALERMGELGEDDLVTALADPDPAVRRRAATIAARHPGVDLTAALDDPDAAVVEAATWATGERGAAAAGMVERLSRLAAEHGDPLVREGAVAALGAIGHDEGLDAVLAALRDKPAVRRRAVVALAAFDDPRAEAALREALHDRDRHVRATAEELLGGDPAD